MKIKHTNRMKTTLGVAILAACIALIGACKPSEKEATAEVKERVYNVKTSKVKIDTLTRTIENTATFTPFEEIHFAPAAPGRIDKIYVEIGDKVKAGQKIADMDKTQLKQAKIQLDNAKISLDRIKQLRLTESISKQQLDQAQMGYDVAKSNIDFLEENTVLLSPISGIVTGKYYENGEMFSGGPNTQAGKAAIVSLMQIKPLKAILSISESDYPNIKKGMSSRLTTDTYNGKLFTGEIYRIHPTINPATRTFMVEIVTKNQDELLRPGMFARVSINLKDYSAMVVPAISVLQQEGTNTRYVFVNKNGIAKRINVTIGKRFNDLLEVVSSDLNAGDELITVGQANLMDNYKIKVVN